MEKHTLKISIATLIFVIMCFFQTCGSKGKTIDNRKEIKSLQIKVDSLNQVILTKMDSLTKVIRIKPSIMQVNHEMVQTMYKFLIYEDDLDKGRISLSEIENRIHE